MIVNLYGEGGSSYLDPGDYLASIFEVKENTRSNTPGVDVVFKDMESGRIVKDTFWITEKAKRRLANLAIACGYSEGPNDEIMRTFNPMNLQGRSVMIRVAKEAREQGGTMYSVVKSFWSPKTAKEPARQEPATGSAPSEWDGKSDPFEEDPF